MSEPTQRETMAMMLRALKVPAIAGHYEEVGSKAAGASSSTSDTWSSSSTGSASHGA